MSGPVHQGNYPAGHGGAQPDIPVLHVDEDLLVLDKPAGMLSVPGRGEDKQDCLSRRVQLRYPDALVVHRLDMATSGLMLMARGAAMQRILSGLFARRGMHKRYVAVVAGRMEPPAAPAPGGWSLIDLPIAVDWPRRPLRVIDRVHGKPSYTRWRTIADGASTDTTRVELEPATGRSHQLRVHLQALGHPILGDALYAPESVRAAAPRLLLHAAQLGFIHPLTGEPVQFQSRPDF